MKKIFLAIMLIVSLDCFAQVKIQQFGTTRLSDSSSHYVIKPVTSLRLIGNMKIGTFKMLDAVNTLYFQEDTYEFQTSEGSGNILTIDSSTGLNMNRPIQLLSTSGTVSGSNDSDTLQGQLIKATTKSLTTGAGLAYTYTLYNDLITSASNIIVTLNTESAGIAMFQSYIPVSGRVALQIYNLHPSVNLNNTVTFTILILN